MVKAYINHLVMIAITLVSFNLSFYDEWADKQSAHNPFDKLKHVSDKAHVYKAEVDEFDLLPSVIGYPTQYADIDLTPHWLTETMIMDEAYKQCLQKFGESISQKIEPAFKEEILPELKQAVSQLFGTSSFYDLDDIGVTHTPSAGRGEKIMHVYNRSTGDDLLRFHVRIDRPPKKGHVFQFHYHVPKDNYDEHHELGSIYWGKNEPPLYSA
nr:YpjP family protein [Shouchella xiaoxiensis]